MDESKYLFRTFMYYDLPLFRLSNRISTLLKPGFFLSRGIMGFILIICFLHFLFPYDTDVVSAPQFLVFSAAFIISSLIPHIRNRNGGALYRQMLQENNGQPVYNFLEFYDDTLHIFNSDTGNRYSYSYDQISSLAQSTEHIFITTVDQRFLCIQKSCISGGSAQALSDHLLRVCQNCKPKRIRNCTARRIVNASVLVLLGLCTLLAVFHLPIMDKLVSYPKPISNSMSYQQIASELEPLGIHIGEETIKELEEFYDSYDYGAYGPGYSKVMVLLCFAGLGSIDEETWEWTPSESRVYWFDMEVWRLDTMYSDFLRGVSALNPEELDFTNIQEDLSKVDLEDGSGTQSASFDWNGQTYQLNAKVNYDWFDPQAAEDLNRIIQTQTGKSLYFAFDGGQGFLVFYGTSEWAREFKALTGIPLKSSTRILWY